VWNVAVAYVSSRTCAWKTLAHPVQSRGIAVILRMTDIDKRFGGVHALRGAQLEVRRGEIMGLCGENGAGKSTLLKVLAGIHGAGTYTGDIAVDGVSRRFAVPADAQRAGIAVVHQELMLVPELTVAQNLLLGREPRRFGLVDHARLEAQACEELARFGFAGEIDVTRPIHELGIGLQQIVEIVRALAQDARILVLDEPTAALTTHETELLLARLRALRERGTTCIYVSHRLDEVFALCERVTVLRDGRTAATLAIADTTPADVVRAMVGRTVESAARRPAAPPATGTPVLELDDLCVNRVARRSSAPSASGPADGRRFVVEHVSLAVHPGEIVAIAGAMGSGRTALLSALFGCARAGVRGTIRIGGEPVTLDTPIAAIARGLALIPEDRKGRGIVPFMSARENLALPSLASPDAMGPMARLGLVDAVAETQLAERRIGALAIRGETGAPVVTLSGGNQQKVVLGKWLERRPRVLLLDEPTRGVDVGAREEIYRILEALAADGVAILFASSDLAEVRRLARRAVVLRAGRIAGELAGAAITDEAIVQLSTGAVAAEA
jgi:D-xylose transport system ATP-binding protein